MHTQNKEGAIRYDEERKKKWEGANNCDFLKCSPGKNNGQDKQKMAGAPAGIPMLSLLLKSENGQERYMSICGISPSVKCQHALFFRQHASPDRIDSASNVTNLLQASSPINTQPTEYSVQRIRTVARSRIQDKNREIEKRAASSASPKSICISSQLPSCSTAYVHACSQDIGP